MCWLLVRWRRGWLGCEIALFCIAKFGMNANAGLGSCVVKERKKEGIRNSNLRPHSVARITARSNFAL
ncbi:hypothetical protein GMJAKD_04070 [Candidatus Electrothrix aarhusensis]